MTQQSIREGTNCQVMQGMHSGHMTGSEVSFLHAKRIAWPMLGKHPMIYDVGLNCIDSIMNQVTLSEGGILPISFIYPSPSAPCFCFWSKPLMQRALKSQTDKAIIYDAQTAILFADVHISCLSTISPSLPVMCDPIQQHLFHPFEESLD